MAKQERQIHMQLYPGWTARQALFLAITPHSSIPTLLHSPRESPNHLNVKRSQSEVQTDVPLM